MQQKRLPFRNIKLTYFDAVPDNIPELRRCIQSARLFTGLLKGGDKGGKVKKKML